MSDARFLVLAIGFGLVFIGLSYFLVEITPASPILIGAGVVVGIASQVRVNGDK